TIGTVGDYNVTVTDGNGCQSTCNKHLTVNNTTDCTITGNASVCQGSTTQWCAPSGAGLSYVWQGPEQDGATSRCITTATARAYSVTVTDGNGCMATCNKQL